MKKIDAKEDRINRLRQIMKDAKVRWFNKKAPMLAQCFEKIEAMGGFDRSEYNATQQKERGRMDEISEKFPGHRFKVCKQYHYDGLLSPSSFSANQNSA